MVHVAESGDKIFTVRAASPPREHGLHPRPGDLADKYCEGHLRFTSRNNAEFMLGDLKNVDP
jgi:sulfite reductase beta subunit